ncbi:Grx4 family monothiol glutaredoxin [Candidatus Sneabacter namystus]|uniref:Grx4 family monothiol glutaredoxin n=1 Tax=Candidatus Sneabacter namystus TaxID=2601646 RepID=A0A5C0UHE4_9RICK|nr:Grx4 family monothiol glutaredoxin [Candidatus Sneabacter namystus]QEK39486.1 Grx4 family monothiol glutaredoxin [Candidatus Sneabacter namystus]
MKENEDENQLRKTAIDFIQKTIKEKTIVVFMKGTHNFPQCGFSAQVVNILRKNKFTFCDVNIFSIPYLREEIKQFSNWPTIPQLYVKQVFVGGSDIVSEMESKGIFFQEINNLIESHK